MLRDALNLILYYSLPSVRKLEASFFSGAFSFLNVMNEAVSKTPG